VSVEATGETVGEAKWQALRELEKRVPGLDKEAVTFQVVSEGERGILGVGYAPARVVAAVDAAAAAARDPEPVVDANDSEHAAIARAVLERIVRSVGVQTRIVVVESEEEIVASCSGGDLGVLIGKHGQTIDAIQYLLNAIMFKAYPDHRKHVTVDAAGYRERRRATLDQMAVRSARLAVQRGERVALDPMTAVERKVVHEALKAFDGVETTSEGTEPNRHVVIVPA
jgi:spoIIIJ-associated protein